MLALVLFVPCVVFAQSPPPPLPNVHPRLLLDATTLNTLRARAAAGDANWISLKQQCDAYLNGRVFLPNSGKDSSNPPDVGPGYQGQTYPPVLLAEGLCYQVGKALGLPNATQYGDKAAAILVAMATPTGSGGEDPCTDDGWVIRMYGVGFGLGYDWAYDRLTPAQRTAVYTTANTWVDSFQHASCSAYVYAHPVSNYFAGFFHAQAVIALATYDENPSGPTLWNDWFNTQFNTAASSPPHVGVLPYFTSNLAGAGWPEGFGSYGPEATFNMSTPAMEASTATGRALDIVNGSSAFRYPVEMADYLLHFTWPSRDYIDDRDENHSSGNASAPPPGELDVSMLASVLGELRYWGMPNAPVFQEFLDEANVATGGFGVGDRLSAVPNRWRLFLFWDPAASKQPLDSLPRSYFARGMNAVAARADWSHGASWMSFRAGRYVENPDHAEERYDQGSLALVRGGTPLLVNGTGWIVHEPDGNAGEDGVLGDTLGYNNFCSGQRNPNILCANNQLNNIFYVRNMSGATLNDEFGQYGNTAASTKVSTFEDGYNYVLALGTSIEKMYKKFAAGTAVSC